MTREQFLLLKLAEECQEVAQRALKAAQFGLSEIQEGQPFDNERRLVDEITDLAAVEEILRRDNSLVTPINRHLVNAKKEKVEKYFSYSQSLGQVDP